MTDSDRNRINAMLVECATALMLDCGVPVVHDPAWEPSVTLEDGMLAILGFGGKQMRGSLIFSASRGLLAAACPKRNARDVEQTDSDTLQDWGGELANQLLGRMKSRLIPHGVTIQFGIPTTVSGLELRVRSCGGERAAAPFWLRAGADWLVVRLDVRHDVDGKTVALSPPPQRCVATETDPAPAEGDILLF